VRIFFLQTKFTYRQGQIIGSRTILRRVLSDSSRAVHAEFAGASGHGVHR